MVIKSTLVLLLLFSSLFGEQSYKQMIDIKVQTILDQQTYQINKPLIDIIFTPEEGFVKNGQVDAVRVIQTLKENGLLKLFFNKPTSMILEFKTNSNPLFFVKIVGDTLRDIGYYRYVTKSSSYNNSEFTWSVALVSEYVVDPMLLQKELQKSHCSIVDIQRDSPTKWIYTIDISHANLEAEALHDGEKKVLGRSLYSFWLDVSHVRKLRVVSKGRNRWYPRVSYYAAQLHLVKVLTRDKRSYDITLVIPKNAKYIKIADIYTMKNIKDSLVLHPAGSR